MAQIPNLQRRRRTVRPASDRVSAPAALQERAEPLAEIIRTIQFGDEVHQRILRHSLVRSGHRQDQPGAVGFPEQVPEIAQRPERMAGFPGFVQENQRFQ